MRVFLPYIDRGVDSCFRGGYILAVAAGDRISFVRLVGARHPDSKAPSGVKPVSEGEG